jgi:hypothetical protein
MSVTFKIECNNCKTNMRYDADYYVRHKVMHWTCWECNYWVQTMCLINSIIQSDKEEE